MIISFCIPENIPAEYMQFMSAYTTSLPSHQKSLRTDDPTLHRTVGRSREETEDRKELQEHPICGVNLSSQHDLLQHTIKMQPSEKALQQHMSVLYGVKQGTETVVIKVKKPFECTQCGKSLANKHNLIGHMKRHIGLKEFSCHVCQQQFGTKSEVNRHVRLQHRRQKNHICQECGKAFAEKKTLEKHIEKYHTDVKLFDWNETEGLNFDVTFDISRYVKKRSEGGKHFMCEECGKSFSQLKTLQNHIQKFHTGEKPFSCEECEMGFATKKELFKHKKIHDPNFQGDVFEEDEQCFCGDCGKEFESRKKLRKHMREQHSTNEPFYCDICHKPYPTRSRMNRHKRETHPAEKNFSCEKCGKAFSNQKGLKNHLQHHAGIKLHQCNFCGKKFWRKVELEGHVRKAHTGETPFKCSLCPKAFSHLRNLKEHLRSHTDERSWVCETCGAGFQTKKCLEQHKRRHLVERPFVCEICQKGFNQKHSLKLHIRQHTGERPFQCATCGTEFAAKHRFKEHIQKCGERLYECKTCSLTLLTKKHLQEHRKIHTQAVDHHVENVHILPNAPLPNPTYRENPPAPPPFEVPGFFQFQLANNLLKGLNN